MWIRRIALQAEHQMRELQEILAAAEGFRKIGEAKRGLQARKVIQQLLHTLRQLGSNLRPVLPSGAFVMLGAQLIGSPATSAVGELLTKNLSLLWNYQSAF